MAQENEQERPIVARIDNRFVRGDKSEVTVTAKDEVLEIKKFETTPAVVRRGYGLTMNLGNYESARIDVGIEVPCYIADIEKADEFARRFVDKRIKEEVRSVREPDGDSDGKKKDKRSPL